MVSLGKRVSLTMNNPLETSILKPIKNVILRGGKVSLTQSGEDYDFVIGVGHMAAKLADGPYRAKRLLIPHGIGDIDVAPVRKLFVSGSYWETWAKVLMIKEYGLVRPNQIQSVGWPKLDALHQPEEQDAIKEIANKYRLSELPREKTVLYAPSATIGNDNSFDEVMPIMFKSVQDLGINMLVKVHEGGDRMIDGKSHWGQWTKVGEYMNLVKTRSDMRWIDSNENIVYLYPHVDLLVSDVSSCLREFIVTDKPSLQIDSLSFTGFMPSRTFECASHTRVSAISGYIQTLLDDPSIGEDARAVWRELLFSNIGDSSEAIVKIIGEM